MITESQIYWITRLDNIRVANTVALILLGFAVTLLILFGILCLVEKNIKAKVIGRRLITGGIVSMLFFIILSVSLVLVPTTKEMCAIKIIPMVVNDEQIQEIPAKFVNLADEWIEELGPKSVKEKN